MQVKKSKLSVLFGFTRVENGTPMEFFCQEQITRNILIVLVLVLGVVGIHTNSSLLSLSWKLINSGHVVEIQVAVE